MPPELSNAALLRKFRIVLGFFMIAQSHGGTHCVAP